MTANVHLFQDGDVFVAATISPCEGGTVVKVRGRSMPLLKQIHDPRAAPGHYADWLASLRDLIPADRPVRCELLTPTGYVTKTIYPSKKG